MKGLFFFLVIAVLCSSLSAEPIPVEYETEDKVLAVVLTGTIGFGTGHLVLGTEKKEIFAYGALAAATLTAVGLGMQITSQDRQPGGEAGFQLGMGLMFTGALTMTGLRIWEISDLTRILLKK